MRYQCSLIRGVLTVTTRTRFSWPGYTLVTWARVWDPILSKASSKDYYVPNSHVPGGKSDGQRCLVSLARLLPTSLHRHFIARRGCPTLIWSVHGSNFVGAKKELILITPY